MSQFVDRRLNAKNKSAVNRQRFIRRYKNQIKRAVADSIHQRKITDIDKSEKIILPPKDVSEPTFRHGMGGKRETVHPGNEKFITGDKISRPQRNGEGTGNQANQSGEGEDNFTFELSREEFLDLYFEDLALPDLTKKELTQIPEYKYKRAGFATTGTATNINIIRSMKQATGRRLALRAPYKKQLQELNKRLKEMQKDPSFSQDTIHSLKEKIRLLKQKIKNVPFVDTIDIRYNRHVKQPTPMTQAVMFCLMDVSGSMDEIKKNIAKRFFVLLYLFLNRTYEKIDLVFIRHHTSAKEVTEDEFFYSRETGGTVVSSALELMQDIMKKRYSHHHWNIYAAQASDGDNWNADSPHCQKLLRNEIMPFVQYYAYVEIMPRHHQSLWEAYSVIRETYKNFAMQNINNLTDIYPVFRELFKKEAA